MDWLLSFRYRIWIHRYSILYAGLSAQRQLQAPMDMADCSFLRTLTLYVHSHSPTQTEGGGNCVRTPFTSSSTPADRNWQQQKRLSYCPRDSTLVMVRHKNIKAQQHTEHGHTEGSPTDPQRVLYCTYTRTYSSKKFDRKKILCRKRRFFQWMNFQEKLL